MPRFLFALPALVLLVAGATGARATDPDPAPTDAAGSHPWMRPVASPPPADVTLINGAVPPGSPAALSRSVTVLDVVDLGMRYLVFRDWREPGTRTPIHLHPYGGSTCVLSGQMTLYREGADPQVADSGECYWMPAGVPVAGVNSGTETALMVEQFAVPPGQPFWYIIEPGQEHIAGEFGASDH